MISNAFGGTLEDHSFSLLQNAHLFRPRYFNELFTYERVCVFGVPVGGGGIFVR